MRLIDYDGSWARQISRFSTVKPRLFLPVPTVFFVWTGLMAAELRLWTEAWKARLRA